MWGCTVPPHLFSHSSIFQWGSRKVTSSSLFIIISGRPLVQWRGRSSVVCVDTQMCVSRRLATSAAQTWNAVVKRTIGLVELARPETGLQTLTWLAFHSEGNFCLKKYNCEIWIFYTSQHHLQNISQFITSRTHTHTVSCQLQNTFSFVSVFLLSLCALLTAFNQAEIIS